MLLIAPTCGFSVMVQSRHYHENLFAVSDKLPNWRKTRFFLMALKFALAPALHPLSLVLFSLAIKVRDIYTYEQTRRNLTR